MTKPVEDSTATRGISPVILGLITALFIMAAYNNTFFFGGLVTTRLVQVGNESLHSLKNNLHVHICLQTNKLLK